MRNLRIAAASLGLIALLVATGFAMAEEKPSAESAMAEEMAAWAKVAAPGEHHEHIAKMAGNWNVKSTFWAAPGADPMHSTGLSSSRMVLGGRFLQTDFNGTFMGQPFKGMGFDGYDNVLKKHTAVWMDTMGTMMMNMEGKCSEGGKVVTMHATFPDPTGKQQEMKSVTTVVSDTEFKWEGWQKGPDGKMFKAMEVVYTKL